jgi:hypothetical protein
MARRSGAPTVPPAGAWWEGEAVNSARHDLILLVRLQKHYDQIAEAIRERQTPPPEVRELQQANLDRQAELEKTEEQVGAHQDELAQVRKKEEEWKLELEHFQRQKAMVTNEREFTAVISEIDYATRELKQAQSRRQELEDAIAALSSEIEERRTARPDEEAAHKDVVEAWEQRKRELVERVHELVAETKAIEADLAPKHRARFMRLLESKRGTAMAAVVEGSCSLCHFALRPHLQQRVRRCEEIISCETCHRILYLDEMVDDSEAASESS